MRRLKAQDVRHAARGRWLDILGGLAGDVLGDALAHRLGTHVDCPFHGGKEDFRLDGSGSRFGDAAENGGAICTCGTWKDGFALLMEARGWGFPTTLKEVARYLGMETSPADPAEAEAARRRQRRVYQRREQQRRAEQARRDSRVIAHIRKVWDECLPITHEKARPMRLYLAGRGLSTVPLSDCSDVRFHPALPYYQAQDKAKRLVCIGQFPAVVALLRDATGEPMTLHRTYLTEQGTKLPVEKPKKLMEKPSRTLQGGAVRLFPTASTLGVAEGLETSLAVQFATGMPTWSVISAPLMQSFDPPEEVERLVIWADRDRSKGGIHAAEALRKHLAPRHIDVEIQLPPLSIPAGAKSVDWEDVWVQGGALLFPQYRPDRDLRRTA